MRAQRCYWRWSVGTILRTAEIRMEETGEADRVKSRCRNKNAGDSAKRLLEGRREARRKKLLVSIKTNAMPQAVREGLVIRPEPGIADHFARGVIHGAGKAACASRIQRRILRSAHNFKNVRHFF